MNARPSDVPPSTAAEAHLSRAPSELRLKGLVPCELTFTVDELRRLPCQVIGPIEVVCMTGRHIEKSDGYRGVALVDLLRLTGLAELPRPVLKACIVIAHGGDGYRALFTWTELFNTPTGSGVLVVYEKNGRPMDERAGPLGLISSADLRLGPRHLRQLQEVSVICLPDEA